MNNSNTNSKPITIIKPVPNWKIIDFKELKEYRDLFYFLVLRDIKTLYAQTILGLSWAILQPLVQIVIFTIIFGKIAKLPTDGIPYLLFSSVAIIPWIYMSTAMISSSESLVSGQQMLGKVYFPRLIFPLIPVLSKLVGFFISLLILFGVVLYYSILPTWNLLFLPLMLIMMISIPAGIGMWLSSLAIRFRDVKYVMPFVIRMLMYSAPIVYSTSSIPERHRIIYSLNPIVGVMEGYRACLIGTPMPWPSIWLGMGTTFIMLVGGTIYFKRMERVVVDVI